MATSSVAVGNVAYVSLGNGPMLISPQDRIMIVGGAAQPAANAIGHPIVFAKVPFYFPLADVVWAIALGNPTTVIATL